MIHGIYAIKNSKTGCLYIGSSKNIPNRIKTHFTLLKRGKHENKRMQDDYNKGDQFKFRIIKRMYTDNRSELYREESKTIEKMKAEGKKLYNIGTLYANQFISEEVLASKILSKYCKEHFGRTFEELTTNAAPAKIEMYYYLMDAKTEEEKEKIKDQYKNIIDYQNKNHYYKYYLNLDYNKLLQLPECERKKIIKEARKKKR